MLLTVDQAAERLGTSVRFIRRLRTEGRIPVVKLGKHIRIDSNDLDAFIAAGRQEAWTTTSAGLEQRRPA
jgi:excisionase family DNA binding protein